MQRETMFMPRPKFLNLPIRSQVSVSPPKVNVAHERRLPNHVISVTNQKLHHQGANQGDRDERKRKKERTNTTIFLEQDKTRRL